MKWNYYYEDVPQQKQWYKEYKKHDRQQRQTIVFYLPLLWEQVKNRG